MRREKAATTVLGGLLPGKMFGDAKEAKRANAEQRQLVAEETARLRAVADGQARAGQTGGGGLLAYVDDDERARWAARNGVGAPLTPAGAIGRRLLGG